MRILLVEDDAILGDGILAGLKDGTITRTELEACAGRILALSKELS